MKKLLSICFLLTFILGCKKSDATLSPIEIDVSGLTIYTGLDLLITDVTQHNTIIFNINALDGNAIYSTAIVYPGDQISIQYGSNTPLGPNGEGTATLQYFYKGTKLGETTGSLGYPNQLYTSIIVPAQ